MKRSQLSTVSHMLKVQRDCHFALLATCFLTPLVLVTLSVSNHFGCSVFDWLNTKKLICINIFVKESFEFHRFSIIFPSFSPGSSHLLPWIFLPQTTPAPARQLQIESPTRPGPRTYRMMAGDAGCMLLV